MTRLNMKKIEKTVKGNSEKQFPTFLSTVIFFKDSKTLMLAGATLASLATSIVTNPLDYFTPPILTGAFAAGLIARVYNQIDRKEKYELENTRQIIRSTNKYKMCFQKYNDIVGITADLIRRLGARNSLEVAILYNMLLSNGDLSFGNESFQVHSYKVDNDYCPELYGARVASRKGSVRHVAANLRDIYEELGYTACCLTTKPVKNNIVGNTLGRIIPKKQYSLLGILEGDNRYAVDPINGSMIELNEKGTAATVVDANSRIKIKHHIDYEATMNDFEVNDFKEYQAFRNASSIGLNRKGFVDTRIKMRKVYANNKDLIEQFKSDISNYYLQLACYERELTTYHDGEYKENQVLNYRRSI